MMECGVEWTVNGTKHLGEVISIQGARSTVMKKALRLEKIGKYMFCLDAVINGVVIWNNASENNYELIFQSSANIVFGYISTYGGPPGMISCGNNVLFYDFCSSWIYILSDNRTDFLFI